MTYEYQVREIKKQSMREEIANLKYKVGYIRKNDPDSSEDDPDARAYRQVIKDKERELENI